MAVVQAGTLDDDFLPGFERFRQKGSGLKWQLAELDSSNVISFTYLYKSTGDQEADYKALVDKLVKDGECRFAIVELNVESDGLTRSKIVLIQWLPDSAPTRKKMTFAASKDVVRNALNSWLSRKLDASVAGDMELGPLLEKLK